MTEPSPEDLLATQIFHPHAFEAISAVKSACRRFVHYTSAEVAVSILKNREVWMRKTTTMNDFLEIEYGWECLVAASNGEPGKKLNAALEATAPGVQELLKERINGWAPHFRLGTYLACFSEHRDEEDEIGRLSMWRAYGGSTGVALVVKNDPFLRPSDALKAYSSPVAYLTEAEFGRELERVADNLFEHQDFVRALGSDAVLGWMFRVLQFAMLCTKHPGFREEREWRVVYSPAYDPSERIVPSLEVINGTPQTVMKVPLRDCPEEGLTGIEIPEFLDRIIIGPTQHGWVIREAFADLLAEAGVDEPERKIWISDIPLRQ